MTEAPMTTTPVSPATPSPTPTAPTAEAPWYSALPADLQADPTVAKYTTLEGATRGLLSAVKMIGERPENMMKLPTAGDPDALRAAMVKLGLPESPETYRLAAVEGGAAIDSPLAQAFQNAAYEAGVLPQAMQSVFEKVGSVITGIEQQQAQAAEARETEHMALLSQELGSALDDTLARAETVANQFGLTEALNEAGLGTHPGVIKALAKLWPTLQEDTAGPRTDRGVAVKSPAEYAADAMDLQRQAMAPGLPRSQQLELSQRAFRLRQLANAGR